MNPERLARDLFDVMVCPGLSGHNERIAALPAIAPDLALTGDEVADHHATSDLAPLCVSAPQGRSIDRVPIRPPGMMAAAVMR